MDEEYFKRITYGTPENIRIRRLYNQLQNRPINYGMENLFSKTTSNINQITTPYHNTSFNNMPQYSQNRSFGQKMKKIGNSVYQEFSNDANLIKLGAENFLNEISRGNYGFYNQKLGGNYYHRKQNYYNSLSSEELKTAAKLIDGGLGYIANYFNR